MNDNIAQLLDILAERGIKITADGSQLRIRAAQGAMDEALRDRLQLAKPALLAHLQQDGPATALPVAFPDPAGRHEPFPLTEIQEAYWIGATSGIEGGGSYHYYLEFACENIDLGRLEAAWQALIDRHDMLRAVMLADGRQQVLSGLPPYRIVCHDLSGVSDPAARLAETRTRLAHRMPDLGRWPVSSVELTRLPGGTCHIHVSLGLIVLDSFSMMILFREWQQLYQDPDTALPMLALTFRDYVLAERQLPTRPAYREAQAYWQQRIAKLPPAPDLPMVNSGKGGNGRFYRLAGRVAAPDWARLKSAAQHRGITPSGLLLTAFSQVLAAFGRNRQFTLNLTLFNRLPLGPGVNGIVGDFTSVTPLSVDLTISDSFVAQARALNRQLQDDLDQRSYPGVAVLRDWARHLGATGRPLAPVVFSSTLVLDTAADFSLNHLFGGKLVDAISQTPQCNLDHQVMEDQGELIYHWDVAEGVYPFDLIEDMLAAYDGVLALLLRDETAFDRPFAIPVPASQAQRHASANATDAPIPPVTLVEAFRQQVARAPEATAVHSAEAELSYRQLEAASLAVAQDLLAAGVRPEEPIAICLPKGAGQCIAVFGVLMAGGAYLPLDPDAPVERNRRILQRAGARVVLGAAGLGQVTIKVDPTAQPVGTVALPALSPDQLAYVLFTSGSTGEPKGAMITHQGVVNRMSEVVARFGLTETDRALGMTALHHDLSVFDIFAVLAFAGGTLVLPAPKDLREPAAWAALMQAQAVTLWNSVPAFMSMLTDHLATGRDVPQGLRWVILSGDFIPLNLPDRIRSKFGPVEIISAGGPTETTVWDICHRVEEVDRSLPSIPYGRPMANARYHVLGPDLVPRPDWVPGELCISGTGLARGYIGDPDLTAQKFVTHPQTGEQLYLSGDLGYWRPDGTIAILGRSDFQIKINGQRIEIGEIEASLESLPGVARAVVTAEGNPPVLTAHVAAVAHTTALPGRATEMKLEQAPLRPPASTGPAIALPLSPSPNLFARQSHRQFLDAPIPLAGLSGLLSCLAATVAPGAPLPKRQYPSAGSLYPVQTWLHVRKDGVTGLPPGLYFLDPQAFALHPVAADPEVNLYSGVNLPLLSAAHFTLFLIGRGAFIEPAYPGAGRDFCLIEAGHMAQELARAAPAQGIGLCPLGAGVDLAGLRMALRLPEADDPVYMLAGGLISADWSQEWREYTAGQHDWEAGLRQALRTRLPRHMEPQRFRRWSSLPLSANGKVDRKALAAALTPPPTAPLPPVADDMEQTVAALLAELMGGVSPHPTRPFFELGATSLTLVQLRGKITQALGVELPMAELFGAPSLRSLAGVLRGLAARTPE